MAGKTTYKVVLSSTYKELAGHREAVLKAMWSEEFVPLAMESSAAEPDHTLISASLEKVDAADGYVGLIGYRHGQTPIDAELNPQEVSITELEFRRAIERGIPICMFIMHGDHPVPRHALDGETELERRKLNAFIDLAKKDRIYAEFESVDDLRAKAIQSLVKLRASLERRAAPAPSGEVAQEPARPLDVPPGWEIVSRDALAKVRAHPPTVEIMAQFFDGILPTWRLVLAQGVQSRAVAERLANRLRAVHAGASKPEVVLLAGAGGEGKSTAILHAAASLVEDGQQDWTCLHRQAANVGLPEDSFSKLPITPGHAWVVVIDDADNIGPAILAAVRKIAPRTDVHLLMAARDAEWQLKHLVPGMWQPVANFHAEHLAGLSETDARRIVAGWVAWGDEAMGLLKGRGEDQAVKALLGHARDFAARKEDGELLGALLVTRQGEDMRAHVRTLVEGLGRKPVIKTYGLRNIYAMIAAMHAENQLYLSRSVLGFALGDNIDELERKALRPLRSEAMLDSGDNYVLTRHRRIAEAACAVMLEDGDDISRWYPFLARAAQRRHPATGHTTPEIAEWSFSLAEHFVAKGERWWSVGVSVAKAVCEAEPERVQGVTTYSSILRRTERAAEAMEMLKAVGERFRNRRDVLYEWGAVAGALGDYGLDAWLGGRSLADGGDSIDAVRCKLSLAGLGAAFRELFKTSEVKAFTDAKAACGQLGLRLQELDATARGFFEKDVAEGRRNGIAELSSEQCVDAIRKAVILGADEVEPENDPVFFERLLGEPDGYRYTALLRMVGGAKTPPSPQQTKDKPGRRK